MQKQLSQVQDLIQVLRLKGINTGKFYFSLFLFVLAFSFVFMCINLLLKLKLNVMWDTVSFIFSSTNYLHACMFPRSTGML